MERHPPAHLQSLPAPYSHLRHATLFNIFPHHLINGMILKKVIKHKMRVLIFSTTLSDTFVTLNRIERVIIEHLYWSSCQVPNIPVRFQWNLNFLYSFKKNTQISNFKKIRPSGAKLLHADSWTVGMTDLTKLMFAFHNFANMLKIVYNFCLSCSVFK